MKFGHIGIKVMDMEKSIDFYQNVLGCKVTKDTFNGPTRLVFLDAHGVEIELIYKEENEDRTYGSVEHLAFDVEDLDEKLALIKKYDVDNISDYVYFENKKIIFFDGPNKERFEFAMIVK